MRRSPYGKFDINYDAIARAFGSLRDDAEPRAKKPKKQHVVNDDFPPEHAHELGRRPDAAIARELDLPYKQVRAARLKRGLSRHVATVCGTSTSYSRGCRCDECREAHARRMNARYHEAHPDATHYRRRT